MEEDVQDRRSEGQWWCTENKKISVILSIVRFSSAYEPAGSYNGIFSATKPRKGSLNYNYDRKSQIIGLTGDEH